MYHPVASKDLLGVPRMIFEKDRVHLTPRELKTLRTHAAQQRTTVGKVETREELLEGIVAGLDVERAEDILKFLDGDSSVAVKPAQD